MVGPMRSLSVAVLLPLVLLACANLPPRAGSDEEGRRFGELFLKSLRWDGPESSADLVAPEVRPAYLAQIKIAKADDDHLKIANYEPKELVRQAKDRIQIQASIDWYVEPDVTVHHAQMKIDLRHQHGGWAVVGLENGPIPLTPLPLFGLPAPDGGAVWADGGAVAAQAR